MSSAASKPIPILTADLQDLRHCIEAGSRSLMIRNGDRYPLQCDSQLLVRCHFLGERPGQVLLVQVKQKERFVVPAIVMAVMVVFYG